MAKYRTIRLKSPGLESITVSLKNGETWIARNRERKIVSKNNDWVMMIRDLQKKALLSPDFK